MNAAEARKLAEEQRFNNILKGIMDMVNRGGFNQMFDKGLLDTETISELRNLGYQVETDKEFPQYYNISW